MLEAFGSGLLVLALWFGPFILAEYLCLPGSRAHERKQADKD